LPIAIKKLIGGSLATFVLATSSTQPSFSWHGRHHHPVHTAKREDATKHKLHGVKQSVIEGYIIQNDHGDILECTNPDVLFNPASTLKLATSYMALTRYGATSSLPTEVFTNSELNSKGELQGDIYVKGANPLFLGSQAEQLAKALNEQGIYSVKGDLIVSPEFSLNIGYQGEEAAKQLKGFLEGRVHARRKHRRTVYVASGAHVQISGHAKTGDMPDKLNLVASQDSPKLHQILKVMLCYSHNGMAETIGSAMGGPKAVSDFIVEKLGVEKDEIKFSSSSGLGVNRITPRAMSKILVAIRDNLKESNLTLSDILPVAGIDPGTLEHRFTTAASRGTVVAKTGTLPDTDRGVSALAGEMRTQTNGTLTFVIFEQHGSVNRFRRRQEELIAQVQRDHGGPVKFDYEQKALISHLHH
jgi:D-alanyl-D-alanine carboxypeptidase/D-alanyl-D-alanine-endopeptidase (penicillin-binding protein 4)